ncbi:DUF2141 domain-containing protein [Massilia sp. IC2-476]|uniref:DUF2141 domain-containing protein n=1 Tax=Massilia sp. IC2-476 TaxID=2887199 RepID=UPI001D10638F|nr:DUF2141 domain-containing protein [Massilia sp. IC2-476]MCC2970977.1 DUF2141 domain-containing protein [Massilia sp. IC2-476]
MNPIRSACLALSLLGCTASAADLTVRVTDVKSSQGNIMVAVYDSPGSFLRRPMQAARVAAAAGSVDVVIKDLPVGAYGIALFHDANGNGKMDSNPMGIPVEDHAFSNNALGNMGPPSFEQVKFALPADGATATISLR